MKQEYPFCHTEKHRTEEEKKKLKNRLARIAGQVRGIEGMVENDAYCNDVLVQLSAVKSSVKSLSTYILENHLCTCVARDLERGEMDTIDEIISLFKRFDE